MDAAVDIGRNPVIKHETGRLHLSRETKFSGANGDEEFFPCSADHEHDWQPYPVDLYSAICYDHTCVLPRALSLRHDNLVSGYECRRVFPAGVGPG